MLTHANAWSQTLPVYLLAVIQNLLIAHWWWAAEYVINPSPSFILTNRFVEFTHERLQWKTLFDDITETGGGSVLRPRGSSPVQLHWRPRCVTWTFVEFSFFFFFVTQEFKEESQEESKRKRLSSLLSVRLRLQTWDFLIRTVNVCSPLASFCGYIQLLLIRFWIKCRKMFLSRK